MTKIRCVIKQTAGMPYILVSNNAVYSLAHIRASSSRSNYDYYINCVGTTDLNTCPYR